MRSNAQSDSRGILARLRFGAWIRYFAVIASAALFSATFPPHNNGWIAWFALLPFFLALQGINRVKIYILSAIWFLVFSALIVDYYFLTRSLVFITILGIGLVFQIVMVSEFELFSSKYGRWGWLLFSGLWVSMWFLVSFLVEMVYPLPPDLPYPTFANTQWLYSPILQILPFVGEFGLTFLIILVNNGLAQILLQRHSKQIIAPIAIILILLFLTVGWGVYHLSIDSPVETLGVAILPTGGGSGSGGDPITMTREFVTLADSNRVLPNDFINPKIGIAVWAEIPFGDLAIEDTTTPLSDLAAELHLYLVADFYETRSDGTYLNVAGIFGPDGTLLAQNAKRKIPPVVEGSSASDKDAPTKIVTTPWGRMSSFICYDTFFPDVIRRAAIQGVDFIAVPANPASDNTPHFTALHLSQTMLRAVENHTAIVLSYAKGISAIIDSNGKLLIHESLDQNKYMKNNVAMSGALPVGKGGTFYSKHGAVFSWIVLLASVASVIVGQIRKVKKSANVGNK